MVTDRQLNLSRLPRYAILVGMLISASTGMVAMGQTSEAGSRRADYLVDAQTLQQELKDGNVSILDVREKTAFSEGHIPGSAWLDIAAWRVKSTEKFGLKDAEYWSKELSRLGVDHARPTVVVGDAATESARAWWVLRYLGMSKVRLLDGGVAAWRAAGCLLTTDETSIQATQPTIEFQSERLAELADVLPEALTATKCQILDNRSTEEYKGSRGLGTRAGHIPSARHLEWKEFLDESGRFLPDDKLKKILDQRQVDLSKPVITHCQTGGRSSVGALVAEMLGGKEVRNYVLGWSEYSGQLQAPIE